MQSHQPDQEYKISEEPPKPYRSAFERLGIRGPLRNAGRESDIYEIFSNNKKKTDAFNARIERNFHQKMQELNMLQKLDCITLETYRNEQAALEQAFNSIKNRDSRRGYLKFSNDSISNSFDLPILEILPNKKDEEDEEVVIGDEPTIILIEFATSVLPKDEYNKALNALYEYVKVILDIENSNNSSEDVLQKITGHLNDLREKNTKIHATVKNFLDFCKQLSTVKHPTQGSINYISTTLKELFQQITALPIQTVRALLLSNAPEAHRRGVWSAAVVLLQLKLEQNLENLMIHRKLQSEDNAQVKAIYAPLFHLLNKPISASTTDIDYLNETVEKFEANPLDKGKADNLRVAMEKCRKSCQTQIAELKSKLDRITKHDETLLPSITTDSIRSRREELNAIADMPSGTTPYDIMYGEEAAESMISYRKKAAEETKKAAEKTIVEQQMIANAQRAQLAADHERARTAASRPAVRTHGHWRDGPPSNNLPPTDQPVSGSSPRPPIKRY